MMTRMTIDKPTVWRKRILFRHLARKPDVKDLFDDIGKPESGQITTCAIEIALRQITRWRHLAFDATTPRN